jgi:hypothetical protein
LEANPKLSYGDSETENMFIQGDNLEALKALLPYYAGKVKCICKGEIYVDLAQEKKNIGERWEEKSAGKALFLMAVKRDEKGRSVYKQIEDKISGKY